MGGVSVIVGGESDIAGGVSDIACVRGSYVVKVGMGYGEHTPFI